MNEDIDDEDECEEERERDEERKEEWEEYKESMREWREQYKEMLSDWKERIHDWKEETETSVSRGSISHFSSPPVPPVPPAPPLPPMHSLSAGRANVVASRIGNEELRLIDMLIEANVFDTRSEAVAYLVSEGIKARRDIFEKVSTTLEEIRKTRNETEKQVEKLKEEIGLHESKKHEETNEHEKTCPKCAKGLSDLPEDIRVCPYCGTELKDE